MVEHTVKSFENEISQLRGLVAELGGLAELAIRDAIEALVNGNDDLARRVIVKDAKLDALESEIERFVLQIIALRAPMADDLRDVIAALKISTVVERIGDYAKNIAKRVGRFESQDRIGPLTLIPAMAEIAQSMVRDALNAYGARNPKLAVEVILRDQKVDNFYNSIFRNLVSHMMEKPSTISDAAQLLFIARNLERIGDHATNVAEMVYFAATGDYYLEHSPDSLEENALQ